MTLTCWALIENPHPFPLRRTRTAWPDRSMRLALSIHTMSGPQGILGAAAAILAVEAYHGGGVRMLLSEVRKEIIPAYGVAVGDVANAITNLRAVVGNGGEGKRSLDVSNC